MQMSSTSIRLTQTVETGGCAAKLGPLLLHAILGQVSFYEDSRLITGFENFSDVGIYSLDDRFAIVQTVDFFPPMVDDPFDFGEISAANALSDLYASGATPLTAMNIVCFPDMLLDSEIMISVLKGAASKLREAKTVLVGGHTISDATLKFGLSLTGIIKLDEIRSNSMAKVGDLLVLTKPLGTGLINTAVKKGETIADEYLYQVLASMKKLNNKASGILQDYNVKCCTDISGFGLIGHAYEIAKSSRVCLSIQYEKLLTFSGFSELQLRGVKCSGTARNKEYYKDRITVQNSYANDDVLFDPQTSGGLLFSVAPDMCQALVKDLIASGYDKTKIIGEITPLIEKHILVK